MNGLTGGFLRVLSLILVFILGFLACAGSLVLGGLYVYRNVSYETLQKWGLPLPSTDRFLDTHADVRLTAMTLEKMVQELQSLLELDDELTLQLLVDRYGVKIPSRVEKLIPPVMMDMALAELASKDGIKYLLSHTYVDFLYEFLPEDLLSEPAKETLKDKTLADVLDLDMAYLLDDMELGFFTDVTYEKQADGSYLPVYKDPENPTTMELLAPLSLGAVLDAVKNDGDLYGVIKADIGTVELSQLMGEKGDKDAILNFMDGMTLGDLIEYDEEQGKHTLKAEKLVDGKHIGDLQRYEPVYGDPTDPERITDWLYGGVPVAPLDKAIADILIKDFAKEGYDITEAVGHLYLGEVIGYTQGEVFATDGDTIEYRWIDETNPDDPFEVVGMDRAVANITLGEIMGDEPFNMADAFDELYLGEVIGYTRGDIIKDATATEPAEYEWLDGTEPVTGVQKTFSNYLLGDIMDGTVDISADDMMLHEVLGLYGETYTADVMNEDGVKVAETEYTVWYTDREKATEASAIFGVLAEMKVGELSERLSDIQIGSAIGQVEYQGAWYEVSAVMTRTASGKAQEYVELMPAGGVMTAFVDLTLEDMSDNDKVQAAVNDIYLADALGYTEGEDGRMYDVDVTKAPYIYDPVANMYRDENGDEVEHLSGILSLLAPKRVGELESSIDTIYLGEIIEWKPVYADPDDPTSEIIDWMDGDEPGTGFMRAFADLTVKELSNESAVHKAVEELTLAEAMNYVKGENGKYYEIDVTEAPYTYDPATESYYDGEGDKVDHVHGVLASMAGAKIGHLEEEVQGTYVGEIMGWTPVYADPDDPESKVTEWLNENGETERGIAVALAALTMSELSDEARVEEVTRDIKLSTVLDFTEGEDGHFYEEHVTQAPYTYVDGVYYDGNGDPVAPATGIVVAFATLTVGEMHDHEKVQEAVGRITVAEVMDYEVRTEGGKDVYYDGTKRVEGIMAALAGSKIEGLDDSIHNLKLSDVFSEDELDEGFLSLIDAENTYLYDDGSGRPDLTQAVANAVTNACVGELLTDDCLYANEPKGAGLIALDAETGELLNGKDKLMSLFPGNSTDGYYWCAKYDEHGNITDYVGPYVYYWKTLPVDELLSYILSADRPDASDIHQSVTKPTIP